MANSGRLGNPGRGRHLFYHWISNETHEHPLVVLVPLADATKYMAQFYFGSIFSLFIVLFHVFATWRVLQRHFVAFSKKEDGAKEEDNQEEETSKKRLTFFYFGGQTYLRRPFLLALVRGLGR